MGSNNHPGTRILPPMGSGSLLQSGANCGTNNNACFKRLSCIGIPRSMDTYALVNLKRSNTTQNLISCEMTPLRRSNPLLRLTQPLAELCPSNTTSPRLVKLTCQGIQCKRFGATAVIEKQENAAFHLQRRIPTPTLGRKCIYYC